MKVSWLPLQYIHLCSPNNRNAGLQHNTAQGLCYTPSTPPYGLGH